MNSNSIFVADVGNTSIDIGRFELSEASLREGSEPIEASEASIPRPTQVVKLPADAFIESEWLEPRQLAHSKWIVGSVNPTIADRLQRYLLDNLAAVHVVERPDFVLPTVIRNSNTVGIDRLASCTAANRLRSAQRPAIIVDAGSAVTVDCVSHDGVFLGGMIAPGLRLCAETLAKNTNQLPSINVPIATPRMIGDDTSSAIQSGVYWLVAAGVDGILDRLKRELAGPCDVFVTGGSMPLLLPHFARHHPIHRPHLVLSGLATLHKSL